MSSGDRSGGRMGGRGQSEVIGVVLLLSFTVLAAGTIVVVGSSALDSHQQAVDSGNAENELALLGSRAAEVALGDSNVQSVPIDDRDGEYEIREDAGRMVVEHVNRTGTSGPEEIANVTLGSVAYSNGDTELAFQGGGIWERNGGNSTMISPPNFYYRDGTLTLPVINVTGDDRTSGLSDAVVRRTTGTERVFPSESGNYTDGTDFRNPVDNGSVQVTVHSEYYEGWREYFDERTEGSTSVDHGNETATVKLVTLGDEGATDLEDGRAIRIRGAEGDEPMDEFTINLTADNPPGNGNGGGSQFNNLDWTLEVDGERVVNIRKSGIDVTIRNPVSDEEWVFTDTADTFGIEEHEDTGAEHVSVNLTSTAVEADGEDNLTLGDVFNEVLSDLGPDVDLEVEDANGNQRIDHDNSDAFIEYADRGNFITYLQITENEIEVEFT